MIDHFSFNHAFPSFLNTIVTTIAWLLSLLEGGAHSQFSCTVGVDCRLPLFAFGLPPTPSLRVNEYACGSATSGSGVEVIGTPSASFPLGIIPTIVGRSTTLHVCLSSNDVTDPTFSVSFGSVDVVGPTISSLQTCYFGSTCRVSVEGNKLSRIESVVFLASVADGCETVPPSSDIFGLTNTRLVLPSSSSPFTYIDFGVVDPSLSEVQALVLCWSAIGSQGRSVPVSVGTVLLTGPTDRAFSARCFLGSECTFTYSTGQLDSGLSFFMVSDSSKCEQTAHAITWSGTTTISTRLPSLDTYSFGVPVAVNNVTASNAPLCWGSLSASDFLVQVGTLEMVGPSRSDTVFTCASGLDCNISIAGVFPAILDSRVSIQTDSCIGPVNTTATARHDGSFAVAWFHQIGFRVSDAHLVVCWTANVAGAVAVLAGTLEVLGPRALAETVECDLSDKCLIQLALVTPAANSSLSLVATDFGKYADPCLSYSGSNEALFTTVSDTTDFTFNSINIGIDPSLEPAIVRSICWKPFNASRAVYVGAWTVTGPYANISATCQLSSSAPCNVTTDLVDLSRVYLVNPGQCLDYNVRSVGPSIRGSLTSAVVGWTDVDDNSRRVFDLCFSKVLRRRPSRIGTVTFVAPIKLFSPHSCSAGSACSLTIHSVPSGTALDSNSQIALSTNVGCSEIVTENISVASSPAVGVSVFNVPTVPIESPAILYVCYDSVLAGNVSVT